MRFFNLSDLNGTRERSAVAFTIGASALTLLALWLAIAAALILSRQSTITSEQRVLQRMSSVVQTQTSSLFATAQLFLTSADTISALQPSVDPRTNAEFVRLARALQHHSQGVFHVALITRKGELSWFSSVDKLAYMDVSKEDFFLSQSGPAKKGALIGMPFRNQFNGTWHIPFSRSLAHLPGGFSTITVSIEVTALEEFYEQGRTKPDGSITLALQDGTILGRAPNGAQFIGKSIAQTRLWKDKVLKEYNGFTVLPKGLTGPGERFAVYSSMEDVPLVVIGTSTTRDVLTAWQQWLYATVFTGLVVTFLVVLATRRQIELLKRLQNTRKKLEDQIWSDFLTSLPNRRKFYDQFSYEKKRFKRSGLPIAIMFLDLDLFKEVNDTLGHGLGDKLLVEFSQLLRDTARESDTVARLSGDEFTVILPDLCDIYSVELVAQRVLNAMAKPFTLDGNTIHITVSIGITIYPQDGSDIDELMSNVDQAMYAAKNGGRNQWKYFTPSMQIAVRNRRQLREELYIAIAEHQFCVHYQPIIELATGRIMKAEALIRWHHPTRGLVGPANFIHELEETGLIIDVGDWIFRESARQVAKWRKSIHPDFQISVNKSPVQLRNRGSSHQDWGSYLQSLELPGNSMAIEITEGLLLDASDTVKEKLRHLSNAGIHLSLDDFGTGYSALSYLKKFDIDHLKIDRSFVSNLDTNSDNLVLCEAIAGMAHKLGLKVIAEGIETEAELQLLTSLKCDYGQGYFFSKPVSASDFEQLATCYVVNVAGAGAYAPS